MTGKLEELLDELFAMVQNAKNMPFSSEKCVLERERVLELIDEIRATVPAEVSEAQMLVSARSDYIASAKREAEAIKQVAEEEADRMATEEEIYKLAVTKSRELIANAEARSRDLRQSANNYVLETVQSAEEAVMQNAMNLRNLKSTFQQATAPKPAPVAEAEAEEE